MMRASSTLSRSGGNFQKSVEITKILFSLREMIRRPDVDLGIADNARTRRFVAPFQKTLRVWSNPQALNLISMVAGGVRPTLVELGAGVAFRSAIGAPHPLLEGMETLTLEYPNLVPALRRAAPGTAFEPLSYDWTERLRARGVADAVLHLSTILERVPDPAALLSDIRGIIGPEQGVVVTLSGEEVLKKPISGDTYQRWTPSEFLAFAMRSGFRAIAKSASLRWSCFLIARDDVPLAPWSRLLSLVATSGPRPLAVTERRIPTRDGGDEQQYILHVAGRRYQLKADADGLLAVAFGPAQSFVEEAAIELSDLDNLQHLEPMRSVAISTYTARSRAEMNRRALRLIQDSVRKRSPLAAVRVSHAEIRALGYPRYYPPVWLNRSLKVCFGDDISPEDYADFLLELDEAVRSCDVLGVPASDSRDLQHATNAVLLDAEGIGRDKTKFFGDLHFSLLNSGHLNRIIRASVTVTLITSRNIVDGFRRKFNKPQTRQINIPGEARWMGVAPKRHVPDVYNELLATLDVREQGELFLIGAGLATKRYCQVVRDRGGIALDVGSVFDLWAGAATRTGFEDQTSFHSLISQ